MRKDLPHFDAGAAKLYMDQVYQTRVVQACKGYDDAHDDEHCDGSVGLLGTALINDVLIGTSGLTPDDPEWVRREFAAISAYLPRDRVRIGMALAMAEVLRRDRAKNW